MSRSNMIHILLLATVSVALAADAEVHSEPKPAESGSPVYMHHEGFNDGLELILHRGEQQQNQFKEYRDRMFQGVHKSPNVYHLSDKGPVILRSPDPLPSYGLPDIESQNEVIFNVFRPDAMQQTWTLDYRYLKTGGRDYIRGPGGQYIILPEGVRSKEKKEFPDFDSFLDYLKTQEHGKSDRESSSKNQGQEQWHRTYHY